MSAGVVNTDRIDFISAYCDGWCERCAFTERCSSHACKAAIAMCGDAEEGLELAVGRPHPVDGEPEVPDWLAEFENLEMSADELLAYKKAEAERDDRIEAMPLSTLAHDYSRQAWRWLESRCRRLESAADPVLKEALEIVSRDSYFIHVKLHRALDGRDRARQGEESDEHPVQNDWNGSAKVALISVERSEAAWRVIADATGDSDSSVLAELLNAVRRTALEEFPDAMSFIRPGFDEPWR